jgi:hypothetical protein
MPVYSNNLGEFIELNGAKEFAENKYSILLKREELVNLLGKDVLLNLTDQEYGVFYGVVRRVKSEDMKLVRKLINDMDVEPIRTSSTSLYNFLRRQDNYAGYFLREYRAKNSLLQSYFKDHTQEQVHRLILKKLNRDWEDGLKPYFATFKSKNLNSTVQIDDNGFITMDRLPVSMDLVESIVSMKINDHRKALNEVRKVRVFRKEGLMVPINVHTNLVIELNLNYKGRNLDKLEAATDELIGYLNEDAGVYGIKKDRKLITFNLVYSKLTNNDKREITSSLSIDISPDNIIISPNRAPIYGDLTHLYYGIDRYFKF